MPLASIQPILAIEHHTNADALDVATVMGYRAIVKRDQWKVGDFCVFIEPDSVLPDVPWAAFYRAKSNRVKAIRLRGQWSFGIVESLTNVGLPDWHDGPIEYKPGDDVTEYLQITKYEPPAPQDLNASGPYGYGIPKTDETRWQSLDAASMPPWGTLVDVTLKVDGQSFTAFVMQRDDGTWDEGVGGRSFLYKPESDNHFTRNARRYNLPARLKTFCELNCLKGLAVRGEQYGQGIQKGSHNPHAKLPVDLALFSVWLMDERRYATKGHGLYLHDRLAAELGLPTVPVLERDVPLTPELIKRYAEELETVSVNGGPPQPFEGVVINHAGGSFKVINMSFDSRK